MLLVSLLSLCSCFSGVIWTFTFHFHALEKEMATHSSVLAWRIPGTGEPGGLPFMGSHQVGHDWSNLAAAKTPWLNSNTKQEYYKYFWQGDPRQLETQESFIAQHTLSVSINSEDTWQNSTSVSSVIIWWEHDFCDSSWLSSTCWTNEWKPYKAIMLFLAIITNRYFLLRY